MVANHQNTTHDDLTPQDLKEIIGYRGLYKNVEEEAICQRLVDELTPEQKEAAAQTSYAYWLLTKDARKAKNKEVFPYNCEELKELQITAAKREARRHHVGEAYNYTNALEKLKFAVDFRLQWKTESLRDIGRNLSKEEVKDLGEEKSEWLKKTQKQIEMEMARQSFVLGGYDRMGRGVLIQGGTSPPLSPLPWSSSSLSSSDMHEATFQSFMYGQMYSIERAVAVTEICSRGKVEDVIVICDVGQGQKRSGAPPPHIFKPAMETMRYLYVEKMNKLVVFDPPLWLRVVHALVIPFLAPKTRKKVKIIASKSERQKLLKLIDMKNNGPSLILDDWTLCYDVDMKKYISDTQFLQTSSTPRTVALKQIS